MLLCFAAQNLVTGDSLKQFHLIDDWRIAHAELKSTMKLMRGVIVHYSTNTYTRQLLSIKIVLTHVLEPLLCNKRFLTQIILKWLLAIYFDFYVNQPVPYRHREQALLQSRNFLCWLVQDPKVAFCKHPSDNTANTKKG